MEGDATIASARSSPMTDRERAQKPEDLTRLFVERANAADETAKCLALYRTLTGS